MKFYAKVTSNDLTKALTSISAWDGKTRLAVLKMHCKMAQKQWPEVQIKESLSVVVN
jgi:hypothetical protein